MSWLKKVKDKSFTIPLFTIKFSTGKKGLKIHSVKAPIKKAVDFVKQKLKR